MSASAHDIRLRNALHGERAARRIARHPAADYIRMELA